MEKLNFNFSEASSVVSYPSSRTMGMNLIYLANYHPQISACINLIELLLSGIMKLKP